PGPALPVPRRLRPAGRGLRDPPHHAPGPRRQNQCRRLRVVLLLPPPRGDPHARLDRGPEPRRHHHRHQPRQDQDPAQPRTTPPDRETPRAPGLSTPPVPRLGWWFTAGPRARTANTRADPGRPEPGAPLRPARCAGRRPDAGARPGARRASPPWARCRSQRRPPVPPPAGRAPALTAGLTDESPAARARRASPACMRRGHSGPP